MKRVKILVLLSIVLTSFNFTNCSTDGDEIENENAELTQQEKDDLLRLREEEKLARDVYLYAYNKYSQGPFGGISNSEQSHMDALLVLLNKYNLEDPVLPNRGDFRNQTLQQLYTDLTAIVDRSYVDALTVGATIEDLDIKDIVDFESRTDKDDILATYSKLRCGSRNHMRAYYGQLLAEGVTYTAQYITQTELDAIINSPRERCGGN